MPRVAEADRKRARRPKTKTGCATCKIRKVKCDELRPACRRCTSTGRQCDGYGSGVVKSSSDESLWTGKTSVLASRTPQSASILTPSASASSNASSRSLSPVAIQPSSIFNSDRERDAFSYFLTRTSPQLAGFYVCEFWNRVLPQAAHVDSGIRHAIMALSSAHRLFEETGDADTAGSGDTFGMQQYQLAIRQHVADMQSLEGAGDMHAALAVGKGKEGLERYLASSMLFICIEMLHGHYVSAISLTKAAVRLFYDYIVPLTWTPAATAASPWPLTVLETLLARLQAKAIGLVGRAGVGVAIAPRIKRRPDWDRPEIPAKFASVEEASDVYDAFNWAHAFSSHDADVHDAQDDLRDPAMYARQVVVMDAWADAFAALLADLDPNALSRRERNAIAVLQVRRTTTRISFNMVVRDELGDCNPMLWDAHNTAFADALRRLETVLRTQDSTDRVPAPPTPLSQDSSSGGAPAKPTRHLFTLDFGLVAPLYEVGRLCREPQLRRKAIALLRAHPMREGMWDGLLAARAIEAQMELEEALARRMLAIEQVRSCRDIPRDARIIMLLPEFRPGERWARAYFSRLPTDRPTDDRPREWHFEQILTW